MIRLTVLLLLVQCIFGEIWVVLVSGIYPWSIEADLYQTYYQFTELGNVPKDHVIVMGMDNAANNRENPYPGKVFEYPTGEEVYQYVKGNFDYVNTDNGPDTFLKVLQGIDPGVGSGRVVNSTDDDIIFVQTLSHGSPGAFYFLQEHRTVALHSSDMKNAVNNMKAKKIIFYFNSCYSGSFFSNLYPSDGRVIGMTGSSPNDEANCCCLNTSTSTHFWMDSCFHTRWQLDSRNMIKQKKMETHTIKNQFEDIKEIKTRDDDFCLYGNLDEAAQMTLSEFQGLKSLGRRNKEGEPDDDPKCITDPDAPRTIFPQMFPTSQERDITNEKIWNEFREKLGLYHVKRETGVCEVDGIGDSECLMNVYRAAYEKCNFYSVYQKYNGFNIVDACNQVKDQKLIIETLDEICVQKMNIKAEYSLF